MFDDDCLIRGFAENDQLAAHIREEYQSYPEDIRIRFRQYVSTLADVANDGRLAPFGWVEVHLPVRSDVDGERVTVSVSPNMLVRAIAAWDKGEVYLPGNIEI